MGAVIFLGGGGGGGQLRRKAKNKKIRAPNAPGLRVKGPKLPTFGTLFCTPHQKMGVIGEYVPNTDF